MSLSGIVEVKDKQLKQTQAESFLIHNDIAILTKTLKKSKKENMTIEKAFKAQQVLVIDLINIIKKDQKSFFKNNDDLRAKVGEIEVNILSLPRESDVRKSAVLREQDGKTLSNLMSPVIRKGYQQPIDSQ